MKILILYSSGLDSFIMKKLAESQGHDVSCVYYQHGAPSEKEEIKLLPDNVEIRNIDWLNETRIPVAKKSNPAVGPIYIPGRNMIFALLAACQDLPDEIWLGPLVDEANDLATDKNETFRVMTNSLMNYVLSPFKDKITLRFPFVERGWGKVECVQWALCNGITREEILSTVSCSFHDGTKACGECFQCLKRRLVFKKCGVDICESYTDPLTNDFGTKTMENILKQAETSNDPDIQNMKQLIYNHRYPKQIHTGAAPAVMQGEIKLNSDFIYWH